MLDLVPDPQKYPFSHGIFGYLALLVPSGQAQPIGQSVLHSLLEESPISSWILPAGHFNMGTIDPVSQ